MKKRQRRKLEKKALLAGNNPQQAPAAAREEYKILAVEVWRLKKLLAALPAIPNVNTFVISVERLEDVLRSLKLEIHDPCGQPYDEGMTLSVALFEKSSALSRGVRRIAETISPTVYWDGQLLQPGKVIVETGESEA
jgi:hypothetical protein